MLRPEISIMVYLTEMLISYVFFSGISEKRFRPAACIAVGVLLFSIGAAINVLFRNNASINTVTTIAINLLFSATCFHIKFKFCAFYSVVLLVVSGIFEYISISIVSILTENHFFSYNDDFVIFILECPICKLLFFVAVLIMRRIHTPHKETSGLSLSYLLHPTTIIICLVIFWFISSQADITIETQRLLALASMILLLSTVLLFVTYQHQIEKDNESIQIRNEYAQLQIEKNYFDILEKQNQQLMLYAHDAKKHLAAIDSLNTDERVHSYVHKLSDQLSDYTQYCHSGNRLLDVMIHKYSVECEMRGIDFDYDVKLCNLSTLKDMDLVAILGNLMDNAVEAAAASVEKKITLATAYRNTYSVLIIGNSCDSRPNANNGHLITKKADHNSHGYGLKSVGKTLKKYEGDFEWEYDADLHYFTITAMIGDTAKVQV